MITPNLKPVFESGLFVYTQFGPNRIWICGSMKLPPGADSADSRWRQLGEMYVYNTINTVYYALVVKSLEVDKKNVSLGDV